MVSSRVPVLALLASALLSAMMVPVAGQEEDVELAPVTSMDTGSFHTVVIIRDGDVNIVKDWGANGKGQLGLNDTKDRGDNDGDVGDLLPEVVLGSGLQAVAVTAGLRHTAAIMEDNTVRSWGYNAKGQLGVGALGNVGDEPNEMGSNMVVTELGEGLEPTSISAGGWHTCIILNGDLLKCWGYNQWGELGLGDKNDRGDEPDEMGDNLEFVDLGSSAEVQSIALGDWHTCVLLTDGNVKCFGKNFAGQLGLDDTENRGDEDNEMGDNLNTVFLGGQGATAIACGEEHSCAILDDGGVRCWGLGASGQLGQGNRQNVGDTSDDMNSLANIDLGTDRTAIEIAAGGNHTCARLDTNEIKCWGENNYGELGLGDTFYRGIAPNQMGDFLPALELPEGWTLHALSAGYYHTCALVKQEDTVGNVVCWGANDKGQIGLGISETEHIGDEPDEMGENLSPANLEGEFVQPEGDKWYEKEWFYIVCGVVGGFLLCCLCLLCGRAHRDNSGRGTGKALAAAGAGPKTTEEGGTEDAESASPTSNGTNPNTSGRPENHHIGAATSGPTGAKVGPKTTSTPAVDAAAAAAVAAPVSTTTAAPPPQPAAIEGFAPPPTAPAADSQA